MAMSSSSLWRRPSATSSRSRPQAAGGPLRPDIDPPSRPRPVMQTLAFVLIFALACLQFLPPTHFRDPADPHRSWIPFDPNRSSPLSTHSRSSPREESNIRTKHDVDDGIMHIYSWMDCLDLRKLAVLANSTLSNSRYHEKLQFHFLLPGEDDELISSYYKLKVLLPRSNIELIGQKNVKETVKSAITAEEFLDNLFHEMAPLLIPRISAKSDRFIYVSPGTITKGSIEELFDLDLGPYGIAAAEDCSRRLGDYVDIHVLNAIQRTAAKTWVSDKPYDEDACLPDFGIFLIDARKLENYLIDSILWWTKVLNIKTERVNQRKSAIALAIYQKYFRLPPSWKFSTSVADNGTNILLYDGPQKICSDHDEDQLQGFHHGSIWQHYLPQNSDTILNHPS